eukprot:TRINITY_DN672_c0_g1_i6.p1 TRINITY_DN672_c0_g1~~TRINITY_DN672_c0_g1_i6.p1  ORF type:complete len:167 (-),score=28.46 TRINITY_DN672_c0_g1_i6:13-513(-)
MKGVSNAWLGGPLAGVKRMFEFLRPSVLYRVFRIEEFKKGTYVGSDVFGNKYYQSLEFLYGQNRWVEPKTVSTFDASQIPPEWHHWLHYVTDYDPSHHPVQEIKYRKPHRENLTGTNAMYQPTNSFYRNTWTNPAVKGFKMHAWRPESLGLEKSGERDPYGKESKK